MLNARKYRLCLVGILLSLFSFQCDSPANEAETSVTMESIPAELRAFTSGVIGRNESIFVEFAAAPEVEAESILSLSPAAEGTTTLRGNTLTFSPADGWRAATEYRATVELPGGEDYDFTFRTPERHAEVIAGGLYLPAGGEAPQLRGQVLTNDESTVEEIESLLSVSQDGQSLPVAVEALPGNQAFEYVVALPTRGAEPGPVRIVYDGAAAGFATRAGEMTVKVAGDQEFRLLDAESGEDGTITLRFSQVLDAKQNFNGKLNFNNPDREGGNIEEYTTSVDGNLLNIYPRGSDLRRIAVVLDQGISSTQGMPLGQETTYLVNLTRAEPALRAVADGAILPHTGQRLFPFEAIGITAVQLEVVRIFEDNVTQFLQDNDLGEANDEWQVSRVGRIIAQERIELSRLSSSVNTSRWSRYALNIGQYIKDEHSAIYQVRIGFAMEDALTSCGVGPEDFGLKNFAFTQGEDYSLTFQTAQSMMGDYYGVYGSYDGMNWRDRDDVCKPAYYNRERFLSQNVISSNLGLIAKRNPDRRTHGVRAGSDHGRSRTGCCLPGHPGRTQPAAQPLCGGGNRGGRRHQRGVLHRAGCLATGRQRIPQLRPRRPRRAPARRLPGNLRIVRRPVPGGGSQNGPARLWRRIVPAHLHYEKRRPDGNLVSYR